MLKSRILWYTLGIFIALSNASINADMGFAVGTGSSGFQYSGAAKPEQIVPRIAYSAGITNLLKLSPNLKLGVDCLVTTRELKGISSTPIKRMFLCRNNYIEVPIYGSIDFGLCHLTAGIYGSFILESKTDLQQNDAIMTNENTVSDMNRFNSGFILGAYTDIYAFRLAARLKSDFSNLFREEDGRFYGSQNQIRSYAVEMSLAYMIK